MEKKTFTSREWQNELAQIPDLEKLNKLKNEFENLDLDNELVENIKEEYFKRFSSTNYLFLESVRILVS
ncbi:MAG: hypothetical protein IPJ51_06790 [Saprospiraceae bacterium]|nr:hypothetical protein [Saprospiraceae bacterium]